MTLRLTTVTIDCHDPQRLAAFWAEVLDYVVIDEDDGCVEIGAAPENDEEIMAAPPVPTLLFEPVPEGKHIKNRVHLDIRPVDRSQDAEVERVVELGATHVDVGQGEQSWVVLADPEGNEFCILSSWAPA